MAEADGPGLAATLLRGEPGVEAETVAGGRWAYSPLGAALVSLFVAYHALALLLHTTPSGGLARKYTRLIDHVLKVGQYMRATSNVQTWSMFAPNPHRTNVFVRVLVEDQEGRVWDAGEDMYGRRAYPYVVYDRRAKINRRLAEQRHYLLPYAAHICRAWERGHAGERPRRVRLVKISSRVPPPEAVYRANERIRPSWTTVGFDPMRLPLSEEQLEVFECALLPQGQLSPALRERLGLPPAPGYRPIELETWWDLGGGER